MTSKNKVILISSDKESFEVDEIVALESSTIKHIMEDAVGQSSEIPLLNVTGKILGMVIEYCKEHVKASNGEISEEALKSFDTGFVKVDQNTLFDLILAADYLDIKGLLDLTCKTVAGMMKGKNPEEIRKTFHIINDYTPEEEEEVRGENLWAFQLQK